MTARLQPYTEYKESTLLEEGGLGAFTRHFYKPPEMRPLDEIKADLLALQDEGEDLLEEIVGGGNSV